MVLAVMLPVLALLRRHVLRRRIGVIILSAFVAHTGWHWMLDRAELLWNTPWPTPGVAAVATFALWLAGLVLAGAALSRVLRRFRSDRGEPKSPSPEPALAD